MRYSLILNLDIKATNIKFKNWIECYYKLKSKIKFNYHASIGLSGLSAPSNGTANINSGNSPSFPLSNSHSIWIL